MKIFKQGNWTHGNVCEICKKATDGPVVLVGVAGTEEGGNIQAKQIHLKCIDLTLHILKSGKIFLIQQL